MAWYPRGGSSDRPGRSSRVSKRRGGKDYDKNKIKKRKKSKDIGKITQIKDAKSSLKFGMGDIGKIEMTGHEKIKTTPKEFEEHLHGKLARRKSADVGKIEEIKSKAYQYAGDDGQFHHVDESGKDTILHSGAAMKITAEDMAFVLTGIGGFAKGLMRKTVTGIVGKPAIDLTYGGYSTLKTAGVRCVANTATKKLVGKSLVKSGFTIIAASYIIKEAVGTYPFAAFQITEALQALGLARWQALEANRPDLVEGLDQLQVEILNPTGWEKWISGLPWANTQRAAIKGVQAGEASRKVFAAIIEDKKIQMETGETDDNKWARIHQKELDQQKEVIVFRDKTKKEYLKYEIEAHAAAHSAKTNSERAFMRESGKFWAAQAAEQRRLEAEDRLAIAKFWMAYRKESAKIAEDNRPSNLKFGLL